MTIWSALLIPVLASTSLAVEPKVSVPAPTSAWSSLRQIRMVQDIVSLHMEDALPTQTWVVAEVRPDVGSFEATVEGGYVDDAGKFIVRPGERERTVVTELGSIKILATLTGNPPTLTSYKWDYEWKLFVAPEDQQEELYPLFRAGRGGTAIFRINPEEKDRGIFRPAYLLSDEWTVFVQPAFQYVQANKEVFDPDLVYQHREQLQKLTLDPNPLLAIAATRTLGEAHELDTAFVQGPFTQAKGLTQSVFVYLLMRQLPRTKHLDLNNNPKSPPNIDDAVNKAIAGEVPLENLGNYIDHAKDAATLKDVTVGLISLVSAPDDNIFTQLRVESLLKRILKRQNQIGTHTEADTYLDTLPILMRLRNPNSATPAVGK